MNEIFEIRGDITFPYLKHLQVIDALFITKSLSNEIGETFCEVWKWLCKLLEMNGQNHFQIPVNFSKISITKNAAKRVAILKIDNYVFQNS